MSILSKEETKEIHAATYELIQDKQFEEAGSLIQRLLEEDPNDAIALNFAGIIHLEAQRYPSAYQYFRRALQEKKDNASIWANFGLAAHNLHRNEEAINSFLKSADIDNGYVKAYINAAVVFIEESRWDEAQKCCELALEIEPENGLARKNMAHVLLAKHQWAEGWKYWELALGNKFRQEWVYGDEQRWDGKPVKTLVIYGEQGLGDEINYASCIPDAIAICEKVIIDCDARLETLFRRSFPKAEVHGTRREEHPRWLDGIKIDARCAMASLPSLFRNKDEDFPGTPYLTANPELRKIWRAYFDSIGKPVYGLCFKSGGKLTGDTWRNITPEQFSPLFKKDAVFISLEYKDDIDNPRVMNLPWVMKAPDYDATAALIAELDGVIGIHTTAIHCANAFGVPTNILVPEAHQWRYEEPYLWSKTAKLHKKKKDETWREVIGRIKLD